MKESEKILDRTFDIAIEYISKLNLTLNEFDEVNSSFEKEHFEQTERAKTFKSLEDITPLPNEEVFDPSEIVGTAIDMPPILSKEEYEKEKNSASPLIKKIVAMANKYGKDKRLNYSNNTYHLMVLDVAFKNEMEKALLRKHLIQSKTSYEIAREIIEENQSFINGIGNERYKGMDYPKVIVEIFENRVKELPKSFVWHGDGESGWFDVFAIAYHYMQEIDTDTTYSKFELFIRKDSFAKVWGMYVIIPYLIQELIMLIIGLRKFGYDPFQIMEWVEESKKWVNRNLIHYTILMTILATLIWYLIFA